MKPKGVLIAGAGFLGTALAHRLARDGVTVHLLSPHAESNTSSGINVVRGGIENKDLVEHLLRSCDIVVHSASTTTPGSSANNPVIEGEQNILPTLNLLALMQRRPGTHLIYLSSGGCVYGDTGSANESLPLQPKSYHGAGKVAIEAFLQAFRSQSSDRPTTILRPSNLYGPQQPLSSGFGLVRTMLEKLRTDSVLEIWGNGDAVRDFLYIDDLVDACVRVINAPRDNDTYNVASGAPCSIKTLIETVQRACKRTFRIEYCAARNTDVRSTLLDSSKIQRALGWKSQVTLEDGILRTWQWLNSK